MTREIPSWTLPNTATTSSMLSSNDVAVKFCNVDSKYITKHVLCVLHSTWNRFNRVLSEWTFTEVQIHSSLNLLYSQ